MTKHDILEYFKDINFIYNNPNQFDTLSDMIDKLLEERRPKCDDCGYAYVEGFVHEHLVCEKHPEIEIDENWFCADFWKE